MKHLQANPTAPFIFYRSYSRRNDGMRESWQAMTDRCIAGLTELGKLTETESALIRSQMDSCTALPSGRYMWCGGTPWSAKQENYAGQYNCTSTRLDNIHVFGYLMDLAMQGSGTGAVLELDAIAKLPPILTKINIVSVSDIGISYRKDGIDTTVAKITDNDIDLVVGDSRRGWVDAYMGLIQLAVTPCPQETINISVDLSNIRPVGEKLKGFGGTANPIKLPSLFGKVANILNGAIGRRLTSIECCKLIDEAALVVVAGNIRRCLPFDAMVHTSRGLVAIQDVHVGELVQTPIGYRKVLNKFDQGLQDVYEIETNSSYPCATLNHRIAVMGKTKDDIFWKSVGDLLPGDRLIHNHQILPGSQTKLPPDFTESRHDNSRNAKSFVVPELNADVAWLIGYTHGNGYVSVGKNKHNKPYGFVSWSMNSLDNILECLKSKIDAGLKHFELEAIHSIVNGENTAKSTCCAIRFAEYFLKYVKQPKTSIVVPEYILQGSTEVRSAYIAGLMDSDGSIGSRPPQVVSTIYKSFAKQVMAILSSLGIASRLRTQLRQEGWNTMYFVNIPAMKYQYNAVVAIHSAKGLIAEKALANGFTYLAGVLNKSYSYSDLRDLRLSGHKTQDLNYDRYRMESGDILDIPITVSGIGSYDNVPTFDIEVEEAHCFYCDGYLTHNSAGIRQFSADDTEAATIKDNLWVQDDNGKWLIDPERDALRMSNHTRVFHKKPTLEECVAAVGKQYYSGEGAIQWAGEAVARSNADFLNTIELKSLFLSKYNEDREIAATVLNYAAGKIIDESELEDRMNRYGLNPCFAAGTMILTRQGHYPIEQLIGKVVEIWDGSQWVSIDNFRITATDEPVFNVNLQNGLSIVATAYHSFVLESGDRKILSELLPGDRLLTHSVLTSLSQNKVEGAYLKGFLIGDGSNNQGHAILSLYTPKYCCEQRLLDSALEINIKTKVVALRRNSSHYVTSEWGFKDERFGSKRMKGLSQFDLIEWTTTAKRSIPQDVYNWCLQSKSEFIAGVLDADGCALDTANGFSYQIVSIHQQWLIDFQLLLKTVGVDSKVTKAREVCFSDFGASRGGIYPTKAAWRLSIAQESSVTLSKLCTFSRLKSFADRVTKYKLKTRWNKIESIEFSHVADKVYCCTVPTNHQLSLSNGIVAGQCAEIIMNNNYCNLAEVHLNTIDPFDFDAQTDAFKAASLSVASLLHHEFNNPRYQKSRLLDPIVGVSFTGLFDFFVQLFGVEWLQWWQDGRCESWGDPVDIGKGGRYFPLLQSDFIRVHHFDYLSDLFVAIEQEYLISWQCIVFDTVTEYCDHHDMGNPNRMTCVQPAGSKSLLTGASPGWHPPKATRYIRRMTFGKNDPLALAAIEMGYSVIPSPSDKDDDGNLLDDPYDDRCTEWLVEIPCAVSWADLPGVDDIDVSQFSAITQFDFYMQVQKYWSTHTTSATIELRESEINALATAIYQSIQTDEGYISAALLARFDDNQTYPRMPFEPISKERYHDECVAVDSRCVVDDFDEALVYCDNDIVLSESGPAGCDSDKCLMPDENR